MYEIDYSVPVPEKSGRGRPTRFNFAQRDVGGSILVSEPAEFSQARNSFSYITKTKGWKFIARKSAEGMRIWRVS